jgi:hypothetical protein
MRVLVDEDEAEDEFRSGASNPSAAAHPQLRLTTLNRLLD